MRKDRKFIGSAFSISVPQSPRKRCFSGHVLGIKGSTQHPYLMFGSIGENVLSFILVRPILRQECRIAKSTSSTTNVYPKAFEKHFFLLRPCAVVATTVTFSGKRHFFLGLSLVSSPTLKYL